MLDLDHLLHFFKCKVWFHALDLDREDRFSAHCILDVSDKQIASGLLRLLLGDCQVQNAESVEGFGHVVAVRAAVVRLLLAVKEVEDD